ncbi:transmembrane protein 69 [Hyalella azteca]|uniref:Transmembrane protein 69 n=1 Tax=Hyalella azteca TaxID=294128 RepID=A0A979FH67_HYAAZ|nr:transmembrane protein 69 [Hyalella azteca]
MVLGLAGLIPFAASPYLMISSGHFLPDIAIYQTFYGATILSFLGGVRWGFTVPSNSPQNPDITNLGYSVVPQLWGCGSLVLGHYMECIVVANVGVMLGLAITGYMDLSMAGYPVWFKGLRFCLTVGALLSLFSVLACKFILLEKIKNKTELEIEGNNVESQ